MNKEIEMKIILDAMGTDNYPEPEILGAIKAAREDGTEIILVGQEDILAPQLKAAGGEGLPITIHHASQVLEMTDKPVESTRKKPDNSMAVGMKLLQESKGDAFITMGNSGAAMFNASRLLRVRGVRPAMGLPLPSRRGKFILIDNGANVECRPEHLVQFARMGSLFAQKLLNIENPRVGLLANGEEEGKGNNLVKETFPLLKDEATINFVGNIEPKEAFAGHTEVLVTDGYTGNIFIKTTESVAKWIVTMLKEALMSNFLTKIGGLLIKSSLNPMRAALDPNAVGATPLLGVNGLVFIGHGSSNEEAVHGGIRTAVSMVESGILQEMQALIAEMA